MINSFTKNVLVGKTDIGKVFIQIKYTFDISDKARLSIVGVEGPQPDGNCRGSFGQCVDVLRSPSFVPKPGIDINRIIDIWERWHLNDMRPYCQHQADWPVGEQLSVQVYTTTRKAQDIEVLIRMDRATQEEKDLLSTTRSFHTKHTLGSSEPYPEELINYLVSMDMIEPWKVEKVRAGFVYPYNHPKGLLTKPCPVCGYKYGSRWLYEPVPRDVLEYLYNLPESNIPGAWK